MRNGVVQKEMRSILEHLRAGKIEVYGARGISAQEGDIIGDVVGENGG